jgi:Leucine-rich repeat (LRR) protein
MTSLSQAEMGKPSQRKPALSATTMESARRFLYDEDEPAPQENVALPPAPRTKLSQADRKDQRLNPIVAACMATLATLKTFGAKRILFVLAIVVGIVLLSIGVHRVHNAGSHHNDDEARLGTLQSKIIEAGITSEADFKVGTDQYHALDWLSNHDKAQLDPEDPFLVQRYIMAVVFYSFGDDIDRVKPDAGWTTQTRWMTEAGYCNWYGVSCISASDTKEVGNGSVESISLESNDLVGTIPTELVGLSNLMVLNLGKNHIEGTLPTEMSLMKNLRFFLLRENLLEGTIPTNFGKFSNLRQLHLGGNNLTGEIPKELENSFTLKALALNDNNFEGTVPEFIEMESLGKPSVDGHVVCCNYDDIFLTNLFSSFFICLTKITAELYLDGNNLKGTLPASFSQLTSLVDLRLSNNTITGTLPESFSKLTRLEIMYLDNNNFHGTIPTGIFSQVTRLKELNLENNQFDGKIPTSVAGLRDLKTLYMDHNLLTGNIPLQVGLMLDLEVLSLGNNTLKGTIPDQFTTLKDLRRLILHSNELQGTIPTTIGSLRRLEELQLANNQFSGPIPSEIGYIRTLNDLKLYKNSLEGSVPDEICSLVNEEDLDYLGVDCVVTCPDGCCSRCFD